METLQKLMWWRFHQNNSGGFWDVDANVSHDVFIQDVSEEAAVARLEVIIADASFSCPCCGERWSTSWPDAPTDEPMQYDTPIEMYTENGWGSESTGKYRCHFYDGRVEAWGFPESMAPTALEGK